MLLKSSRSATAATAAAAAAIARRRPPRLHRPRGALRRQCEEPSTSRLPRPAARHAPSWAASCRQGARGVKRRRRKRAAPPANRAPCYRPRRPGSRQQQRAVRAQLRRQRRRERHRRPGDAAVPPRLLLLLLLLLLDGRRVSPLGEEERAPARLARAAVPRRRRRQQAHHVAAVAELEVRRDGAGDIRVAGAVPHAVHREVQRAQAGVEAARDAVAHADAPGAARVDLAVAPYRLNSAARACVGGERRAREGRAHGGGK